MISILCPPDGKKNALHWATARAGAVFGKTNTPGTAGDVIHTCNHSVPSKRKPLNTGETGRCQARRTSSIALSANSLIVHRTGRCEATSFKPSTRLSGIRFWPETPEYDLESACPRTKRRHPSTLGLTECDTTGAPSSATLAAAGHLESSHGELVGPYVPGRFRALHLKRPSISRLSISSLRSKGGTAGTPVRRRFR